MTRVLVIGASGFIGQYLVGRLGGIPGCQVAGTYNSRRPTSGDCDWHQVDLTRPAQLEKAFHAAQPDAVVHLAAMADVGQCEREPERATAVNVGGTESIVRLCREYGARLVFLSTEYVFGGDRGRYREDDPPAPTTHYGRTKWEAEQLVAQHTCTWNILRTSLVYGWPPWSDRANLVTRVLDLLSRGRVAFGYTNQFRSPVYVEDVAEGAVKLTEADYSGTAHVAGPDWVHMGEFVSAIAEAFQLDSSLIVQVESPMGGTESSRPSLLGLDSTQTVNRLGMRPLDMASGLEKMRTIRREVS